MCLYIKVIFQPRVGAPLEKAPWLSRPWAFYALDNCLCPVDTHCTGQAPRWTPSRNVILCHLGPFVDHYVVLSLTVLLSPYMALILDSLPISGLAMNKFNNCNLCKNLYQEPLVPTHLKGFYETKLKMFSDSMMLLNSHSSALSEPEHFFFFLMSTTQSLKLPQLL